MAAGDAFGRFIEAGGTSHAINFLPVESATGGQVGYILAYTPAAEHDELTNAAFAIWLLGSLLLLLTFVTHYRLQKSRHFMSTVAEHMGSGLYVTDNRGRITYVNAAALHTLGYTREGLLGRNAHDTFHGHSSEPTTDGDECPFERVIRGGTLFSSDNEVFRDAQGNHRTVEVLSTPLEMDTGEKGAVTVFRDVTDRKRSEEKLQQVVTALRNSREGVMITDRNLSILDVNEAFTTVTGYERHEILGRTPRVLQSGGQGPAFYEAMWEELQAADNWRGEIWNRRKDGTVYPEWLTISAIRNDDNEVTHYVAIFSDITDLHEANQRLEAQARQDALTGLANRHALERHLEALIRQRDARFAVLFVDLDHFKRVNDTMGHAMGDRLLSEMASRLQRLLRSSDMLARLGGDEFVAVLEKLDHPNDAASVARKLIEEVARPYQLGGNELSVGASVGIALVPGKRRQRRHHAEKRRHGDVPGQGGGSKQLPFLHHRTHAPGHRAHEDREPAAPGDRQPRTRDPLPAAGRPVVRPYRGRRGAAPMEQPRRARLAGRVHPGRRADRPDQRDRSLGADERVRSDPFVARSGHQ